MRPTAYETALLLAVIVKRSGQARGRVSGKTLKILSRREVLRSAFINEVKLHLFDFNLIMSEIKKGGYGLMKASALEGAKPLLAKNELSEEERIALKDQEVDYEALEDELAEEEEDHSDDED